MATLLGKRDESDLNPEPYARKSQRAYKKVYNRANESDPSERWRKPKSVKSNSLPTRVPSRCHSPQLINMPGLT